MMSKIYCPQCNHKPFRSQSGLKWHQEHMHSGFRPTSTTLEKPVSNDKVKMSAHRDQIQDTQLLTTVRDKFEQDLRQLKQGLTEQFDLRLTVFRDRDGYLFEKVSQIEKAMKEKGISQGCSIQRTFVTHSAL